MKKIVVLGANPAWQKSLFFEHFRRDAVNRAFRMTEFSSGKGINFCRAANGFGRVTATVVQFAGGDTGRRLEVGLTAEKLQFRSADTAAVTRCCTTCLDNSDRSMTELIEPSGTASEAEQTELLRLFDLELASGAAGAAFCGTLPGATPADLYIKAAEAARQRNVPLLLDAYKKLEKVLKAPGRKFLKINRAELAELTGIDSVEAGLAAAFERYNLEFAAITDGPGRAYAGDGKSLAVYTLPKLDGVINVLGCGDTASGVLLGELVSGINPFEAFRSALGAASANALTELPGSFDPAAAHDIASQIGMALK